MTSWRLSWTGILFPPVPIQRSAALWRTSHWTRNAGSQLSTGVPGQVMATMQPMLRQTAGCESLKKDSKDQAAFQNWQESLRQQSLSSCQIIVEPSTSLIRDRGARL